jgi:hypothetical protein
MTTVDWGTISDLQVDLVVPQFGAMSDDELLQAQREVALVRRRSELCAAGIAAEFARRSTPELGSSGLAQRQGARTPELLIQQISGTSSRDARTLVRVGGMLPTVPTPSEPTSWNEVVADALTHGRLSVEAADAIRKAIDEVGEGVDPGRLLTAVRDLVGEVNALSVDQVSVRARELRDVLDAEGVAAREDARRERRYLHLRAQDDGMTRISGLLDPESAAIVRGAVDAIVSPRRGGPRFVDSEADRSGAGPDDARTIPQMVVDALVDLVRIAGFADPGKMLGGRRPAVQLVVAERDLREGRDVANIEGQVDAVSAATARRHVCDAGVVAALFDDDGQAVNVGRDQRLFNHRQRVGMAARDGGCRFPGCNRPPSWTEAHHIDEWLLDHGKTDIADGILLCRHHHLLTHNNGWKVQRSGGGYWVVPPASVDAERRPIAAPSRSAALRRALADAG